MIKKSINPKIKIIGTMVIWGTIGLFVRGIDLSSVEIAFFRAFIGSGFLLLMSLINRDKINKKLLKENIILLSISGIALGVNWVLLFQAMKYTTISKATLSYYFAPVFIMIFSTIILKEKLTIKNIICLFGAILGLFLILNSGSSQPLNGFNHVKGILFGLAGAVLYAIVVILNKYIKALSGLQTTLIQLSIASITLLPLVFSGNFRSFKSMSGRTWILILILGVVHTGIAYLLYFPSIKYVKSKSIAILSYLDPIVAIIVSFIFLREPIAFVQVLGGILILSTAYISES